MLLVIVEVSEELVAISVSVLSVASQTAFVQGACYGDLVTSVISDCLGSSLSECPFFKFLVVWVSHLLMVSCNISLWEDTDVRRLVGWWPSCLEVYFGPRFLHAEISRLLAHLHRLNFLLHEEGEEVVWVCE